MKSKQLFNKITLSNAHESPQNLVTETTLVTALTAPASFTREDGSGQG
jgi:hypothetical protein